MIALIDNGHGKDTPGKRSPLLTSDMKYVKEFSEGGRLMEYRYARLVAKDVVDTLKSVYKIDARLVTPEENDVSLGERVRRINAVCSKYGASNVIVISIHCDAAGNGDWMNAQGWSAYTTKGTTKSDKLAQFLYDRAKTNFKGRKIRMDNSDGDDDEEANFYIIKHANCPAVLTENFFMDNKNDVEYMLSDTGEHSIVQTHIEGILDYIKSVKK